MGRRGLALLILLSTPLFMTGYARFFNTGNAILFDIASYALLAFLIAISDMRTRVFLLAAFFAGYLTDFVFFAAGKWSYISGFPPYWVRPGWAIASWSALELSKERLMRMDFRNTYVLLAAGTAYSLLRSSIVALQELLYGLLLIFAIEKIVTRPRLRALALSAVLVGVWVEFWGVWQGVWTYANSGVAYFPNLVSLGLEYSVLVLAAFAVSALACPSKTKRI